MTEEQKEKKKAYNKAYQEANKEKIALKKRENYLKNKERILKDVKIYQEINKEKIKARKKNHQQKNKERLNEISRQYYINNKEVQLEKSKEYYKNNKEKYLENSRRYYKENKEKCLENKRNYYKIKISSDPLFKIKKNTRTLIYNSICRNGYSKKSKTQNMLGCSFEEFKTHLELKFESWMSWDNYGKYNGENNYGWDIDHIIPLSSATCEEEIIKLNHYTNLQPLCSKLNRDIKKDNYL